MILTRVLAIAITTVVASVAGLAAGLPPELGLLAGFAAWRLVPAAQGA
jgi:hypothetical protein